MTQRTKMKPLAALCLAGLILLGCARGDEETPLELEIGQVVRSYFAARKGGGDDLVLTRALLNTVSVPQLEVVTEPTAGSDDRELRGFLVPQYLSAGQGAGQVPGQIRGRIEVWRTVDNVTFTFRDGMLVATRGLIDTMLSADVPADGVGAAGPARGGLRSYWFRAGDHEEVKITLRCQLDNLGVQKLEIVEQIYHVQHLRETCLRDGATGGRVVNEYWVDSRNGRLWQSRQWAGPVLGYIRTRLVHFGLADQRNTALMLGR